MADPAEIAAAAAFLASSDGSFMTAGAVAVDGGLAQL
jgi:NAD(P)-dependent dehydrogenase (short-subunit alcohol dehydrogenase family)